MNTAAGLPLDRTGDGGRSSHRIPAEIRGHNHTLPDSLTTFIGRQAEKTVLIALLRRQDVRLVTLTGPCGIGKTRLATEIAREVAAAFRDGVRFVPLESIGDPELAKLALARAAGLPRSVSNVESAIIEVLAGQHTLLFIDNLEQIVSIAPFFSRLLRAGPDIKMLLTSRTPLRVSGEHVFETPPLALPDANARGGSQTDRQSEAVRLFVDRAMAANPRLINDDLSLNVISQICTRLDGFPLAIELAAAWLNLLKPEAVLQRLDYRLPLLTSGARDQPPRLQSLRDAIGWSYELLNGEAQRLFRTLSIFAGGFSLDALEVVAGPELDSPVDILDVLSGLIDSSLVRQWPPPGVRNRYAVYETIRKFGPAC